jgi:hypothetical protein
MKNIILVLSPLRNGDATLLLLQAIEAHKTGVYNLSAIIVSGQPLMKRAEHCYQLLAQSGLSDEIPIGLGSPDNKMILFTPLVSQSTEREYENGFRLILGLLTDPCLDDSQKFTFIAASGLAELQDFFIKYPESAVSKVEELILLSGFTLTNAGLGELDGSTNNLNLSMNERGLLGLTQRTSFVNKVKITLITKHAAKAVVYGKDNLQLYTEPAFFEYLKRSLNRLFLLSRFDPDDVARLNKLPRAFNAKVCWEQFCEGELIDLDFDEEFWDHVINFYFYDVNLGIYLTNPEYYLPELVEFPDYQSGSIQSVHVIGCSPTNHGVIDSEGIKAKVYGLLNSIKALCL